MKIKPRQYPHPVLSDFSDDIVGAQFQSTVTVKGTKTAYAFDVSVKTSDRDIAKLMDSGDAQYAVHVECPATRYRALFADGVTKFKFEISASLIDGRVEVCTFILAAHGVPKYDNKNFHSDYEGLSFVVRKGDTLAVGAEADFVAAKKTDPLRNIPSIFVVVPNEAADAPAMDLDTTGHKIRVSLSKPNYDAYAYLRQVQTLQTSLISTVIVPALVAVLESIRTAGALADGLDAFESRRWYSTLSRRLKELGVDPARPDSFSSSTPRLAQELIGETLSNSLKSLRSYEETDTEAV